MQPARPQFVAPIVRWAFIVGGVALGIYLSPITPTWWHDTPSLRWLHYVLPWTVQSAGFILYALLLLSNRIGPMIAACALGAFFFLCELVALCATIGRNPLIQGHHVVNGYLFVGLFLVIAFHVAAGVRALLDLESP